MLKSLLNDSRAIWQTVSGLQKRITELELTLYEHKHESARVTFEQSKSITELEEKLNA
jgi:hypothetical protein